MKTFMAAVVILSACSFIFAQMPEKFDIVSYTAPNGWRKGGNSDALTFTTADEAKNVYCAVTIFRAFPARGSAKTNFNAAWSSLVADSFKLLTAPQMAAPASDNGWAIESGVAAYEKDGARGMLMLVTASGGGKMFNVLVLTNTDAYQNQISSFVESIKLPPVAANRTANQTTNRQSEAANNFASGNTNGISKSTTNFSDGWTATVQPDYVLATKGNLRVFVCYPVQIDNQARQTGIGSYFWRAYVQTLFNAAPQNGRRDDTLGIDYAEGNATDKQNRTPIFVAMSVLTQDGTAKVVIAAAPDRQTYYNEFPRPADLGAKTGANYFAVTQSDLAGEWDGRNAPFVQLYSIYTGNAAALNAATFNAHFSFSGNGSYTNQLSGTNGLIGAQNYSEVNLNGRFQVSDWEITLTNRENGKTSVFAAYFEAVKGGKILHLTDKQYSSSQFHLFKVK